MKKIGDEPQNASHSFHGKAQYLCLRSSMRYGSTSKYAPTITLTTKHWLCGSMDNLSQRGWLGRWFVLAQAHEVLRARLIEVGWRTQALL